MILDAKIKEWKLKAKEDKVGGLTYNEKTGEVTVAVSGYYYVYAQVYWILCMEESDIKKIFIVFIDIYTSPRLFGWLKPTTLLPLRFFVSLADC